MVSRVPQNGFISPPGRFRPETEAGPADVNRDRADGPDEQRRPGRRQGQEQISHTFADPLSRKLIVKSEIRNPKLRREPDLPDRGGLGAAEFLAVLRQVGELTAIAAEMLESEKNAR